MMYYILKYFYFFILPTFFAASGFRLLFGRRSLPQRLFGLYFIAFFIRGLAAYQLQEASSSYCIHFHKIQAPLYYVFGPLGYLFFLYSLKPYRKLHWFDMLHFLPFLLNIIELFPFFIGPVEVKYKDLELAKMAGSMINYPSIAGILPVSFHAKLKFTLWLIYLLLELRLMFRFGRKQKSLFYINNHYLIKWLWIILSLKILSSLPIVFQMMGFFNVHDVTVFMPSDIIMFLDVLVSFIIFLLYPKLLNGAIFESLNSDNYNVNAKHFLNPTNSKKVDERGEILTKKDRIAQTINIHMEVDSPYLEEDFSIKVLAKKLNVSERNVSKIIHEIYGQNFPDFVATWRLNYLKKMISSESNFSELSIEKLAEISGFGSRQSLYKVVQRLHHKTPGKFFEEYLSK